MSARELDWDKLQAMPEEMQAAYWRALVERWHHNAERKADADVEFDCRDDRDWWE